MVAWQSRIDSASPRQLTASTPSGFRCAYVFAPNIGLSLNRKNMAQRGRSIPSVLPKQVLLKILTEVPEVRWHQHCRLVITQPEELESHGMYCTRVR